MPPPTRHDRRRADLPHERDVAARCPSRRRDRSAGASGTPRSVRPTCRDRRPRGRAARPDELDDGAVRRSIEGISIVRGGCQRPMRQVWIGWCAGRRVRGDPVLSRLTGMPRALQGAPSASATPCSASSERSTRPARRRRGPRVKTSTKWSKRAGAARGDHRNRHRRRDRGGHLAVEAGLGAVAIDRRQQDFAGAARSRPRAPTRPRRAPAAVVPLRA